MKAVYPSLSLVMPTATAGQMYPSFCRSIARTNHQVLLHSDLM